MATRKTAASLNTAPSKNSKSTTEITQVTPVKTARAKNTSQPVKRTAATRKTTVKTASKFEEQPFESSMNTSISTGNTSSNKGKVRVKKSYVILVLVLLLLIVGLYFGRSWVVAAVVNGQPISRLEVIRESEKQSGKQALNNLVRNVLIEQEARKDHITVSDKEIDDQVKTVEGNLTKQGQSLDQVLAMQGMTKDDLRNLIRLDQLVGKIVGKDIKIQDKDITDYMDKNKDLLPKDQTDAQIRATVRDRLKQQQLNDKVQAWLANLQSKANILYFVNY